MHKKAQKEPTARFQVRFTQTEAQTSERRRRSHAQQKEGRNLRAAVEATIRSIKPPFPGWQAAGAGKVPDDQYGDRFRRSEQCAADLALPAR